MLSRSGILQSVQSGQERDDVYSSGGNMSSDDTTVSLAEQYGVEKSPRSPETKAYVVNSRSALLFVSSAM